MDVRNSRSWFGLGLSLETIVNVLLWAVELYVLAFLLKLFLG